MHSPVCSSPSPQSAANFVQFSNFLVDWLCWQTDNVHFCAINDEPLDHIVREGNVGVKLHVRLVNYQGDRFLLSCPYLAYHKAQATATSCDSCHIALHTEQVFDTE